MDRQMRESLDRYLTTEPEAPVSHEEDGCEPVEVDCCDLARWECETFVVLDANGDPDVRVCRRGSGCDTEEAMWERFDRAQHASMARAEAEERILRYERGEDD